jgi:hypothetical protein
MVVMNDQQPVTADLDGKVAALEQQIMVLAWLHAEQVYRSTLVAKGLAALLAQQLQPQIQQVILNQLTGASG